MQQRDWQLNSLPSRQGFTLVELIATISIVAVLIAIMVPAVGNYVQEAKRTADRQTLNVLNDAVTRYKTQGGDLLALTEGASPQNIITALRTPVTWANISHQFLQGSGDYDYSELAKSGNGRSFKFTGYGDFGDDPPSGLLDDFSGAQAAFAVVRLYATYYGSCIRVRRSSDDAESNIGFNQNGDLDTATLLSFCGAGDGFVTTWYDQSGNGNNATQSTPSDQPRIVSSGSVELYNAKPAIYFNEKLLTSLFPLTQPIHLFFTYAFDSTNGTVGTPNGLFDGGEGGDNMLFREDGSKIDIYAGGGFLYAGTEGFNTQNNLASVLYNGGSSSYYLNGVLIATNGVNSTTPNGIKIGQSTASADRRGDFHMTAIIIYSSDESANRADIESALNGHYSVF